MTDPTVEIVLEVEARQRGRPRKVTDELVGRAEVLRRNGSTWLEVSRRVKTETGVYLSPETCRHVVRASRKVNGGV